MSDNDVTSGDPWGLSSTGTESPPPPPPALVPSQDELPEDLADLSTIADPESSDESEPPTLPDMELAEPEMDSPDVSSSDVGSDLDLGDFGNFSDLNEGSDLGPLAESALADGLEGDAEFSTDMVEGAFADLSIADDLPDADDLSAADDLPGFEDLGSSLSEGPGESTDQVRPPSRPMNPLLAASGLFGGSPSLPPLKENAATDEAAANESEAAATEDIDETASFDEAISSIQFDDSTADFESVELTDGDLPDFDIPAVGVTEPADIDAELAETLNALGDQPADAISFSSDPVFGAEDQEVDSEESTDDSADFYPEFMSQPSPTDEAQQDEAEQDEAEQDEAEQDEAEQDEADGAEAAESEEDDVFTAAFGDSDFSSAGTPPTIYQELEHLDDGDPADTPTPADASGPVEAFDVVFGGSNETADDPFGAVFGSGDDAIAAVAAAASSIETKPPTILDHFEAPTADDLPDFMVDDEDATDPEAAEPTAKGTEDAEEAVASDSSDESDQDEPLATFGLVDPYATQDSVETPADEASSEAAEEAAEEGGAAGESYEEPEATGLASAEAADEEAETAEDAGESEEQAAGDEAEQVAVSEETIDDASINPLPPMRLVETPTLDSDPFAASTGDLKVDAAELEAIEAAQPAVGEVAEAEAGTVAAVHPPILGTIATGVIAKKPIPEDWGTRSDDAYEGWVQDDEGVETWRMIITNLPTVAGYDIDEFLGLAVADSLVGSHDVHAVAGGRRAAIDALTEDGVLRGAHAIVAVTHAVQPIDHQMLVTVSGTAVTLKPTAVPLAD